MLLFTHCSSIIYALFMGPIAILLKNIKNGSHGTIYTFKNYFATVFLVFNFSNNKFNSNGSYMYPSRTLINQFLMQKAESSKHFPR